MARGRPPKSTIELKVAGTYREDRHGKRSNNPSFDGKPIKPRGLSSDEKWMWDQAVDQLHAAGVAKKIDLACLRGLCELWGLYRSSLKQAKADPVDRAARGAVVAYWKEFAAMAAQFGIQPAARTKLQIEPPKQDEGFTPRKRG